MKPTTPLETSVDNDSPSKDGPPSERAVVWVLDDSPMEAAMARRALSTHYTVETFVDGPTLLERIAGGTRPNVLVLDWQLPGMSGIEVLRFLRSERDEMELPILMLTVYGHKSDLMDGLSAGANDYVTKPYDAPELAARVGTLARINLLHGKLRNAERQGAELLTRERAAREDAEKANRAKDDFLAMVSHDLRTPLNAILGWTRMVRSGNLSAARVEMAMATVERNAVAQTQLINELMDMSRVLSDTLTIDQHPLELVNVIKNAVDSVQPTVDGKRLSLQMDIEPDTGTILGDPTRLQQVIWNLLSNAVKFTPQGGKITVALGCVDESVQLSVVDSGVGIEAEFLPHVFERFRQGSRGVTRTHGGLGLGLAIVKHIVEMHGGSVHVRSAGSGLGSAFTVTLPRRRGVPSFDPRVGAVTDRAEASFTRLAGLTVLIVDDEPDALALLGTMLRFHGATTLACGSSTEALDIIVNRRPDVLVSDIGMPEQDGYELIKRVRALPADGGGRTPALALTAFGRSQDRARALTAGFNIYASKPVEPVELVASVASLAGRFET